MSLIAIGVGVAGVAASAAVTYSSQSKANKAQQNALNQVQGVNIPDVEALASQTDLQKYQEQFQAEANVDPQYSALRSQGASGVLGVLSDLANPNGTQNKAFTNAAAATNANATKAQPLISDLLTQAKAELDAGATLPPSFQAELVRSGLAAGGAAGTGVSGEGATGVQARTLLGSAGIALQQQRQAQATSLTAAGTGAAGQQESALNELTQLAAQLTQQKADIGSGAAGMGTAALPSIGLTGTNAAGIATGNQNLQNQKALASGNIAAQGALQQGAAISGILGSLGGGGGSLSGWLGNLGNNSTTYTGVPAGNPGYFSGSSSQPPGAVLGLLGSGVL